MKLSFFKKRKKLKMRDISVGDDSMITKDLFYKPTVDCSPLLEASKVCICKGCTRRGMCQIERVAAETGCRHFVKTCSARSPSGRGPSDGQPYVLFEEFMDYIEGKYLRSYK